MNISLGGIVITNLKKVLSLSGGILIEIGMNSVCFATETSTASNVLSNLLTTTAEAITPKQNQATPATPPPAESASSADATALPTFDESAAGGSAAPATPAAPEGSASAKPVPATTPQPSALPQPATPSATTLVATQPTTTVVTTEASVPPVAAAPSETPVVATPSGTPAIAVSEQVAPVQAAPEPTSTTSQPTQVVVEQKKKVGFLSQNGMVLIAPDDMVFPNEMQDGGMYFFSRDIDALKKKITAGEMALPMQQALTAPTPAPVPVPALAPAIPQTNTVITAPASQISAALQPQVAAAPTAAPGIPAMVQSQVPVPQNDCQGCHVWLKTTI